MIEKRRGSFYIAPTPFPGEVVATALPPPVRVRRLVRADVPRPADLVHGQAQLRTHHRSHVNGESVDLHSARVAGGGIMQPLLAISEPHVMSVYCMRGYQLQIVLRIPCL